MQDLTLQNLEEKIKTIFTSNENIDYMFISYTRNDTSILSKYFAKHLKICTILSLNGELGSGKTFFVNGIAKYFNIEDQVSSPTFTIVNEYIVKEKLNIYHFDIYRLNNSEDFLSNIGTEYFENGICLIEWGDIISDILPPNTIHIDFKKDNMNENIRKIHIWRKN